MKLLEISNLAKCCETIDVRSEVGALYLDPPDHILRESIGTSSLETKILGSQFSFTDVRKHTSWLEYAKINSLSQARPFLFTLPGDRKDMCFIRNQCTEELSMTFFVAQSREVSAWNPDGRLLWSFSGAPTGMGLEIQPCSITVNQEEQRLYVCDEANRCIQIISTDGVYQGSLVKNGEYGLGTPTLSKWYKDTSSLLVVHAKKNRSYVSILKIKPQ